MAKAKQKAPAFDPLDNNIQAFMHCSRCLAEMPEGTSPREWAQLEVGFTEVGLQVWCRRHECNVVHIDFDGQKYGAWVGAKTNG